MNAIITAVAENGVIGKNNKLPWCFPDDMKWFQSITKDSTVVMGRKTFDSLPSKCKPLSFRDNVVLTKNLKIYESTVFCECINALTGYKSRLRYATKMEKYFGENVFYIGGAEIYKLALLIVDKIYLTRIPKDYEGDTVFPAWPLEDHGWVLEKNVDRLNDAGLKFQVYKRRIM